jgi:translation initiation factor 2-alpha kinase 3
MSLFRRPGDDSSSDESSNEVEQDDTTNASTEDLNLLSRINTIDSTGSGQGLPVSSRPAISRQNSHVRDLLLHSLLEEKALKEAADQLNKDVTHPDVQELARATYQALSRQLSGPIDETYSSEHMRMHRITAKEGLEKATRNHLMALKGAEHGEQSALIPRPTPIRSLSSLNPLFSGLPPPVELPLQGYPGLHTDRYAREFVELDVVGKGGYGKVYKVKHKLDNYLYAVKRIMVSPQRLQKIQENGPQEMEKMLEEVRALARFDHGNIVRYQNCWLEFTTAPGEVPPPPTAYGRAGRYIEGVSDTDGQADNLHIGFDSMSFGDPFGQQTDSGAGIVFEASDTDTGVDESHDGLHFSIENDKTPRRRSYSQASQATVASKSSARSHMSTIESVNGEEDDEIEMIPRSHQPQYPDSTTELSQSMMSHSDVPNQLVTARANGPVLTLNVQMSLYDTNLAAYISSEPAPMSVNHLQHCFHPCISMELLSSIVSGVEYLHDQGVVHRDLKPANVFLALSTSKKPPTGSINLSSCHHCPSREGQHVTPRIGDFGLVAALGNECLDSDTVAKPVGTEFYRPEGGDVRVSEKLDVFALGVVAFEMLCKFSTRMERIDALTRLRRGHYPDGFAESVGSEVLHLISCMVHADENKRSSCDEVKQVLQTIIEHLRHKA